MEDRQGLVRIIDDLWGMHPLFARITIERLVLRTARQLSTSGTASLSVIRRVASEQVIYADPDPVRQGRGRVAQRPGGRTSGVRAS
jgi:hypothetical protein